MGTCRTCFAELTVRTYLIAEVTGGVKGGRGLVLRPEGTSSVVRYHAEFNKDNTSKYSYFGSMFRYENPQKNRYREFNQAGAEIIGLIDIYSDFQIINDSLNFINNLLPGTTL